MLLPDHETAVDFLNYEAISSTIVELLKSNRQHALTIGIHGDWGAGKSSILKMIEAQIAKDKEVAYLWFNGWTFQGFDDAKTVLIESTIRELCRQRSTLGRVKEISAQLIKRIDWLKLAKRGAGLAFTIATGIPSPDLIATAIGSLQKLADNVKSMKASDIEGKINEVASFLKPDKEHSIPEEINEFRDEFTKLLEEAKINQLIVLIDDLDRCLPETAIDTLEAIRLFLFVPKTAFIIGADEGMIEYAVRKHFPDLPLISGSVSYARNYLEKLIQVPFRIPALGIQEVRTYVTLLLIEALVGNNHTGFQALLSKARKDLNQPWLGSGLSQTDVRTVEPTKQSELDAAFILAQQIAPILAEGTKGNPRQIKRFLNSLFIRLAIAKARGFGDSVNQSILAKLMLAERFQPDFYEYLVAGSMKADEGKMADLSILEATVRGDRTQEPAEKKGKVEKPVTPSESDTDRWLEKEWIKNWLKIEPALSAIDLRPYIFVVRDKRVLVTTGEMTGLEGLIETLLGTAMAVRTVESQVRSLTPADAETVFTALRERVLRQGNFSKQPPGFEGLMIVAKHHPRYQSELLSLLSSIEENSLGIWVTRGWNEVITESSALQQLRELLTRWATQDQNTVLKKAAQQAIDARPREVH